MAKVAMTAAAVGSRPAHFCDSATKTVSVKSGQKRSTTSAVALTLP